MDPTLKLLRRQPWSYDVNIQIGRTNIDTQTHPAHVRSIPCNQHSPVKTAKIMRGSHLLDRWSPAQLSRKIDVYAVTVRANARHDATPRSLPKVLASFVQLKPTLAPFPVLLAVLRCHLMGLQQSTQYARSYQVLISSYTLLETVDSGIVPTQA